MSSLRKTKISAQGVPNCNGPAPPHRLFFVMRHGGRGGRTRKRKNPGEPGLQCGSLLKWRQLRISSARFRLSAASEPTAPDSR